MMNLLRDIVKDIKAVDAHWLRVVLSNRGFHALMCYRIAHLLWRARIPLIPLILTRAVQMLYGIDIDWRAEIAGVCIVHGFGLVIGQGAVVGEGCRLYHGVTLGIASKEEDGFPCLGRNVLVGAGAKILGPVRIGDNVKVGANSVVITDIPPGATVGGVPARVIRKSANAFDYGVNLG